MFFLPKKIFLSGDIVAYSLDDSNGALIRIFRIKLSIKNGTEYLSLIGRVRQIQCLTQGAAFAVIWEVKTNQGLSEKSIYCFRLFYQTINVIFRS